MTSWLFTIAASNGTVNGVSSGRGSWQSESRPPYRGGLERQLGCSTVLSKRDSNFMLEQGNVALARLTSRNAPARLVPGADLLEDFSTLMRGSMGARTVQVFMRRY